MPDTIISLLPASTEIVCALGLESRLIGRSHQCDYPESVQHLPVCSTLKINPDVSSAAIDKQVKEVLADALSVYEVNEDLIKDLGPDVIITQTQCEVCAISLKDVEAALNELVQKKTEVISLSPNTLEEIFRDIQSLADRLGAAEQGRILLDELTERKDLIKHKLKFIEKRPRVACVEWFSPLMAAGNWTPELIEIAGGEPVLAKSGEHSPYIDPQDLIEQNPDIIIAAACGFSISRSLQEIDTLFQIPGWAELAAVKNNQVYIADGNHYFNRPSPRIVDTIEILAEIINPKQFVFGYEGSGWLKFSV
ncbi:cobalamin-binding protein [Desertivirga xinjiangensis]|uniref:cobalamin-binding protein n=1 Tax=Desertivirga xinjiangensis TaxID=539206 RepID=UPI00210B352E|nr:cobalamin-binding protein [Pedobacter xinjiangensis]